MQVDNDWVCTDPFYTDPPEDSFEDPADLTEDDYDLFV